MSNWIYDKSYCRHEGTLCFYVYFHFMFYRWDTAGQEKFKCIALAYYRGAHGRKLF